MTDPFSKNDRNYQGKTAGPALKFERPDFTLFRTVEGLQQKAGVPARRLRRLVLKELADNAHDTRTAVDIGALGPGSFYVEDRGPGIDGTPEEVAGLFSIGRPLRSTKLLRLPMRGALGNGLRVVAGAVLASRGSLVIITRNRRIVVQPERDGSSKVVEVAPVGHSVGTRIEITFGAALPADNDSLAWTRLVSQVAQHGNEYDGRTSPHWYDPAQFHELLDATGARPVRELLAKLEGCTGATAGKIVNAAGVARKNCNELGPDEAARLLEIARLEARPVKPERLGMVGPDAFCHHHAIERGTVFEGGSEPKACIPFVVEAWARELDERNNIVFRALVNRTPVAEIEAYRYSEDKRVVVFGCGLEDSFPESPTKGSFDIVINITTPYCPITSDGKEPNLAPFSRAIDTAVTRAFRKAVRNAPKGVERISQKDVVLACLDAACAKVSGDGAHEFNERQVLYVVRPIVMELAGKELTEKNFKAIITDYESEHGEIPGMYREPRGSLYHPHIGDEIPLGTLTVASYERPIWTYNKLLYIEKEGFSGALKAARWAERHDCMVTSTKGFTTRAIRDLVDKLAEHDEPVTVYCVHDADAHGTMIYQTFQKATKARSARKIKIANLGLEAWEAVAMGLQPETLPKSERRKPVANYVDNHPDGGPAWSRWLQAHRIELNAMTMPQFIGWLDRKMAEHGNGKLIPPDGVIETELQERLERKVRTTITERILRKANFEKQIANALAAIERPTTQVLMKARRKIISDSASAEIDRDDISLCAGGTGATAYADAIATYLAFNVTSVANSLSQICTWDAGGPGWGTKVRNTFSRQALPMTWDFAEIGPFSGNSGSFDINIEYIIKAIIQLGMQGTHGEINNLDAANNKYLPEKVLISTDPPYYDNIAYADLSDYFYVWLRHSLASIWPDLFRRLTSPKAEELVALSYRHGGRPEAETFFMNGMRSALRGMNDAAAPAHPLAVYYAFKQSEAAADGVTSAGWASFLQAIVDAGLGIDGTWPIRTELANRMIGSGNNALASSIAEARALAYRLFEIATNKGWAAEALVYNELAQEWARLEDLAQGIAMDRPNPRTSQGAFAFGGEA